MKRERHELRRQDGTAIIGRTWYAPAIFEQSPCSVGCAKKRAPEGRTFAGGGLTTLPNF